jgi:BirA family biotin operon repressor/biotin-[acetyl-CoA-carboxylase] ligase
VTENFKNRAPLDAQLLEHELLIRRCLWKKAIVNDEVTSTNDVARNLVETNSEEGTFVLANYQTQGRGRQDRNWEAPKNSSVFLSIILKPNNQQNIGWIPLLIGLTILKILQPETRKNIKIKWPNDLVLVEESKEYKFAGILLEKIKEDVVVGIGINFDQDKSELPIANASSLKEILQTPISKEALIAALLTELSARWNEENNAENFPTPSTVRDYKSNCLTLNKEIEAIIPGGKKIKAIAIDISSQGELVIKSENEVTKLSSADIHIVS